MFFILFLMQFFSYSQADTGGYYNISKIWSWAEYKDGVVVINLEKNFSQCPGGFWLKVSPNSSNSNIFSMALSAYHSKTKVRIYADENADWDGISAKVCKIKLLELE